MVVRLQRTMGCVIMITLGHAKLFFFKTFDLWVIFFFDVKVKMQLHFFFVIKNQNEFRNDFKIPF